MFDTLQERLGTVFNKLTGRGVLSEQDVSQALREIRRALLEADVALEVVRNFIGQVQEKLVGVELIRSIKPGQLVVKLVHDELVQLLGKEQASINLNAAPPVVIMLVGLQGAGKTTTAGKLAKKLKLQQKKKVLLASLDTKRPAAQEQLRQLAEQVEVTSLPIIAGQEPVAIADRAVQAGKLGGYDVVILDTAGRTHIDLALMQEMVSIHKASNPHEVLLVADSLTGQDSVNLAKSFDGALPLTGIVFTRMDGDGRGGAVLSMRAVTGHPIKAIATGERLDDLEDFHPSRVVDRLLGMGDVVSLVEKAASAIDAEKAAKLSQKLKAGKFDLNDLADQLQQMKKMGGLGSLMSMLPGVGRMKQQLGAAGINDNILGKQVAIIQSMTKQERANPEILKHSRKQRIAKGAGVTAAEINKLLKMHRQMADMMKLMGGGKKPASILQKMGQKMGLGGKAGGFPGMDPSQLSSLQGLEQLKDLKKFPDFSAPRPKLPGLIDKDK